jgi:regulator of replication initiation timing
MRDAKSLLLLFVSLLLVLVSFVLIWTWGYRYYSKNDEYKVNAKIVITDSNALANRIRDSLQKIYNETLHKLDTQLDSTLLNSDSLKTQLDIKLGEFFRLSNEITAILGNRNNDADFDAAKQKIGELQDKAEELSDKNKIVDSENKKLDGVLDQLKETEKKPEKNIKKANGETNTPNVVFTASELKFSAIMIDSDKELETSVAEQAKKLVGSFTVINNNIPLTNAEMVVVVVQPDGRILKNSEWDAGSFITQEGKKLYSYKLNFNYSKGEAKRLYFSLKADKCQKGNYTMQVYYNGTMIGRMVKTLS